MTQLVEVPLNVTVKDVDQWTDALTERESLELFLAEPVQGRLLSESRLVGLFAQARFLPRAVRLVLSPDIAPEHFARSPLMTLLGIFADEITTTEGSPLTGSVRDHLRAVMSRDNGVFSFGAACLLPVVDSVSGGYAPFPLLTDVRADTFPTGVERLLKGIVDVPKTFPWDSVAQFAFEMWQNTLEHGLDDLSGNRIDGIRCVIVRSVELGASSVLGDDFASDYLKRLRDRFSTGLRQIVEVSVCDSGVGIAARLSNNPNIRESSSDTQLSFVRQAMTSSGSSKKRRGSGLGYPKVMRLLDKTRGLLSMSTAGVRAGKSYLPPYDPWPSPTLYSMTVARAGIARGTAVTLLVPVVSD